MKKRNIFKFTILLKLFQTKVKPNKEEPAKGLVPRTRAKKATPAKKKVKTF